MMAESAGNAIKSVNDHLDSKLASSPNTQKDAGAMAPPDSQPFTRKVRFEVPPISTVNCFGNSTIDRVCKVKFLCYDPSNDHFFLFKDPSTMEQGVPLNRSYLVDMTSIDGHNRFFFDYHDVHPDRYKQRVFRIVDKLTFMISRFHTYNIMHTIHDDFIGLYLLHRIFASNNDPDPTFPFSQDNHIFFADSFQKLHYDYVFGALTSNALQYREAHRANKQDLTPICFRDAVVGNSKLGSWYTYGFLEPQGPIANKTVSGLMIRDVASYIMRRFHMPPWEEKVIGNTIKELISIIGDRKKHGEARSKLFANISKDVFITIFSRRIDRLMLNQIEMTEKLEAYYGLPVKEVRMEDMHLVEQASILKSTVIAVGMHGSALILSMFLPPGALLVELYPYAVPAENYTPYMTLANLHGMRLAYRSWTNTHPENNRPHPEKLPAGGGIVHLPLEKQKAINESLTVPPHLCCADPYWLYRIYQDTIVHLDELMDTIDDGLTDSLKIANISAQDLIYIRPGSIEQVYCKVAPNPTNSSAHDLLISWTLPWNGVHPNYYGIWVHQPYKEFLSNDTFLILPECTPNSRYDIWVRPYAIDPLHKESFKGTYSDKFTCWCNPDTVARKTALDDFSS